MTKKKTEEEEFNSVFEQAFEEKNPDFSRTLNIAIVGKVSAGKSSLLNAILLRDRATTVAAVGATSGVTVALKAIRLDDRVLIVDSPGLDDIRKDNSKVTKEFLEKIDCGIFVVTGSADASQKKNLDDLKAHAKRVFVVLNKIDEWDKLSPAALQKVIEQWQRDLGESRIYPVCSFGYDPETREGTPLDLRGVDVLRSAIFDFLESEGKELLLQRHLGDKRSVAAKIIVSACVAAAGEAFIPGSAAYITATQVVAITALHYLYTGNILSKSSALGILPSFIAQAAGSSLFLLIKSFLPPTGLLDAAAAAVALTVTAAMLLAVNNVLVQGHSLDERDRLVASFSSLRGTAKRRLGEAPASEWTTAAFWQQFIRELMYSK